MTTAFLGYLNLNYDCIYAMVGWFQAIYQSLSIA